MQKDAEAAAARAQQASAALLQRLDDSNAEIALLRSEFESEAASIAAVHQEKEVGFNLALFCGWQPHPELCSSRECHVGDCHELLSTVACWPHVGASSPTPLCALTLPNHAASGDYKAVFGLQAKVRNLEKEVEWVRAEREEARQALARERRDTGARLKEAEAAAVRLKTARREETKRAGKERAAAQERLKVCPPVPIMLCAVHRSIMICRVWSIEADSR